jgi:alpha-amylase
VYIPTSSYVEMGEWALPPDESRRFSAVLHAAQEAARPEARWLRGAFWRNFQVKYREINDLHKQMLRVSDKVDAMAAGADRTTALDHLYRGQSNDCYWHGLFGGIYIAHMRLATYENLIAAEDIADRALGQLHAAEYRDLDLDGLDDVRLAGPGQVVTVNLTDGAGIGSWDIRSVRHALCAVMRRRPEAYHQTLREVEAAGLATPGASGGETTSIHELVLAKETGLTDQLHYDPFERRSGLVRFLAPEVDAETWAAGRAIELGDAIEGAFEVATLEPDRLVVTRDASVSGLNGEAAVRVTKDLRIGGDRRTSTLSLTVTVTNRSERPVEASLGLEWTLMMLGGGGNPAAWSEVKGLRSTHDTRGTGSDVVSFSQGNDAIGVAVESTVSEPASAWWAPVETITNSEAGFERVYQGLGLLLSWPLALAGGATRTVTVSHVVTTTRDRAVEDDDPRAADPAAT